MNKRSIKHLEVFINRVDTARYDLIVNGVSKQYINKAVNKLINKGEAMTKLKGIPPECLEELRQFIKSLAHAKRDDFVSSIYKYSIHIDSLLNGAGDDLRKFLPPETNTN